MPCLASDEVSPEKLKTREDQDTLDMEQDSVDVDNHEIGVNTDVDLEARLVTEEVGLQKLKTRESVSNEIINQDAEKWDVKPHPILHPTTHPEQQWVTYC